MYAARVDPKHNYFLKAVSSSKEPLPRHWVADRPDLLKVVEFTKRPNSIKRKDRLVYYSAGDQRLIAIVSSPRAGAEADDGSRRSHRLEVQPILAIPDLELAPKLADTIIDSAKLKMMDFMQLTEAEYLSVLRAIADRTMPELVAAAGERV